MMIPISVALVNMHPKMPTAPRGHTHGLFSYPVPQFRVTHYPQTEKEFLVSKLQMARNGHHIIWQDSWRCWGNYKQNAFVPTIYHVTDSTLSEGHFQNALRQAKKMDMVMLDCDEPSRFDMPAMRCGHCVNDRVFYDYGLERDIDIGWYCHTTGIGGEEREAVYRALKEFARNKDYTFCEDVLECGDYATALNRTKVMVNLNRNPQNRSCRIIDGMATRTCVLTDPSDVSGESKVAGLDYEEYERGDIEGMLDKLDYLLRTERWKDRAEAGWYLVRKYHTWAARARQLRWAILGAFPGIKLDEQAYEFDLLERASQAHLAPDAEVHVPYQPIPEFNRPEGYRGSMEERAQALHLDEIDFKDKSVLDLGCNHGAFCRDAVRRGAKTVVGIDKPNLTEAAYELSNRSSDFALGFSNISYLGLDLLEEYDLIPSLTGEKTFDIVYCLALLRYLGGDFMPWIANLCKGVLIYEGHNREDGETRMREMAPYFRNIEMLGYSTDHGKRPILRCWK